MMGDGWMDRWMDEGELPKCGGGFHIRLLWFGGNSLVG